MPRQITSATSLQHLRKTAKRWLRELRANSPEAQVRFARAYPDAPAHPMLRDVQHALAREYGFESWILLKQAIQKPIVETPMSSGLRTVEEYERLAQDLVLAHVPKDEAALGRLNAHLRTSFTFDDVWAVVWRRVYAFRERAFRGDGSGLTFGEAQMLVAQEAGFGGWDALMQAVATGRPPVPPYEVDPVEHTISPRRQLSDGEWDQLLGAMRDRHITGFEGTLLTDALLARIADFPHVTALKLGGSRQLTDKGLHQLARMPQLEYLHLSEYPGGHLTDRGLDVLRHLPNLRVFEMTWQRGISDAGVANLKFCEKLERVDLMGSPTGDGAIEALQGKTNLRSFSTGRLVTDAGLRLLRNFPFLKTLHSGTNAGPGEPTANGARLLIDGPFTDKGLANLIELEGVVDLDLFWHVTKMTSEGFAYLVDMPNLESLGADGALSDNTAMEYFALMPRLRNLRAQETVATDEGFDALSRSTTLESFWGRRCENLGSRGFAALSKLPALRGLGVSCKHVDDWALATLPRFPALRELTPIDVQDEGFRHVGRCERLQRLTCMYCRETTDAATEHIAGLPITYYYAGLTLITDRSLEILGKMVSLEQVELYECRGVTDAGLVSLAGLPRLHAVELSGLPGVTLEGTKVFPGNVRVKYST
jgi:hypothetical protein